MYRFTDKILAYLNKRFIKRFKSLKSVLKFDEINRIKTEVDDCYRECYEETRSKYREIGRYAYQRATDKNPDDIIDYLWIDKFLREYDPVTKYVFKNEADRKRARAFEGIVSTRSPKEIGTALRLWAAQVRQWGDEVTDKATIQGYKDIGVTKVRWNTEKDDRRCIECARREGKVYDINRIPDKPHIGCRCWLTPVR